MCIGNVLLTLFLVCLWYDEYSYIGNSSTKNTACRNDRIAPELRRIKWIVCDIKNADNAHARHSMKSKDIAQTQYTPRPISKRMIPSSRSSSTQNINWVWSLSFLMYARRKWMWWVIAMIWWCTMPVFYIFCTNVTTTAKKNFIWIVQQMGFQPKRMWEFMFSLSFSVFQIFSKEIEMNHAFLTAASDTQQTRSSHCCISNCMRQFSRLHICFHTLFINFASTSSLNI